MTGISFRYLQKPPATDVLDEIFDILATNMRVIAPTGMTYEEDKAQWLSCVPPALEKEARQIVLIYADEELIGFFQYYVTEDHSVFMMEEIQFAPAYHRSGLFRRLFAHLLSLLPDSVEYVEAYANKKNEKSQGILKHLGLTVIGENKNGNSYHFRGRYSDLKEAVL